MGAISSALLYSSVFTTDLRAREASIKTLALRAVGETKPTVVRTDWTSLYVIRRYATVYARVLLYTSNVRALIESYYGLR